MSWNNRVSVVLAAAVLAACGLDTQADVLVLEDPLQGSTCGVRNGGAFSDGGWKIIDRTDWIYWHLDGGCALRKGTVYKGKMQFRVKGLNPNECRSGLKGKSDLFHMYDYTYGNADTEYGGYRNNPFKHFIRKNGCSSSYNNTIDAFELVLVIAPNYQEPDTRNLNWNPAATYLVTEEWGPDGQGNCVFKTYRDGILEREMTEPGSWSPPSSSWSCLQKPRPSM